MTRRATIPTRLTFAISVLTSPAALMLAQGRALAADRAAGAVLPIQKIVLYRSGVGYFERHGRVQGSERVQLRFKADQVNDILKSLVLLDLDGGRIDAVSYNAKEPLARRLASFKVDISKSPSVADLFQQLRGSRVSVTGPEGAVEGTILSVESRPVAVKDDREPTYISQYFVNLVSSAGVKSIMVPAIASFRFLDEELNEELNKALAALAEQREETSKAVDLTFSGEKDRLRRVVAAYIHEMPVWKASYRLVLPDDEKSVKPDLAKKGTLTMQGWAIVENTTDEDWKDVRLSLASGRPVSFTMDLYEPLFVPRPAIPVPVLAGVMPRIYESAMLRQDFGRITPADAASLGKERARAGFRAEASPAEGGVSAMEYEGTFALKGDDFSSYAAQAQATAGEAGETFMYTLDAPVSLDRQRSAMLPILTAPVEGRRVSIYNAAAMPKHPMRGVQFRNSSDLHLMPGPISVYDGAAYAGDSQIPHTSRGQERLLSYAVDLDVLGETKTTGTETILKFTIIDGLLQSESKHRQTVNYTMSNNDAARGRVVLVEHARSAGWDLIEPKEPAETTENLYRFEIPVEASKSASLTVVQEHTRWQQFGLVDYDLALLLRYAKEGKASQAVVDAVKKAAGIHARIQDQARRIADLQARMSEITAEQGRIRSNMNTIERNTDLYRRLLSKLNDQETQMEQHQSDRDEAQRLKEAAEKELRDYLRDLRVD